MKTKHLIGTLCLSLALFGSASLTWAAEVTQTYIFTNKSWKATCNEKEANWTSGTDGGSFSNNGIQVTTTSGANATSPISFTNISKIVVTYNTNKASGAGTLEVKIGTNDSQSKDWAYSGSADGRAANFTTQFDYETKQSGSVKLTVNTTTNSIYVCSIAITYEGSADTVAPVFASGYPQATNIKATSVDLIAKTDEGCKVFYKVVADGADAPSVSDLIENGDSVACTANTETNITISGLEKATAYDIYVVARDNSKNAQAAVTKLDVTTESREISSVTVPAKFYTEGTASITWTSVNIAADANIKIELYGSESSETIASSTVNDGEETITVPVRDYAADYKIRISLADVPSVYGESDDFSIIPDITINELVTDTAANGESNYKDAIVRVKGLVTGIKPQSTDYRNFTLQNGTGVFNAAYAYYCEKDGDTFVAMGDSVYVEGKVVYYGKLLEIGNKNNHSKATIINHDNALPEPVEVSLKDAQSNAYMSKIVKISGLTYDGNFLRNATDSIRFNYNLVSGSSGFVSGRKYDVTGGVGYNNSNKNKGYQLLPRTTDTAAVEYVGKDQTYIIRDVYLYSNDTMLSVLTINGQNAVVGDTAIVDTMYVLDFSTCKGIVAETKSSKASLVVKVNGVAVAAENLAGKQLAENDVITINVTAEDGTSASYNVLMAKDTRTFKFNQLAANTFETGNTISLSWTQKNVTNINICFESNGKSIILNGAEFAASTLAYSYTVANSINGSGYIKAITTADNYAIDSIAVTINDTQAPAATLTPANGATNIAPNFNLTIRFDEAVVIASGAKMKANNVESEIVALGDSAVKAFFQNLDYATAYTITLPSGAVTDAAGNDAAIGTWTITTKAVPVPELYFSEYCTGSSNNKYYEIYNPKEEDVDLSNYMIMIGSNGGDWNIKNCVLPKGILLSEYVYVVAHNKADSIVKASADTITTNTTSFNGDDAIGLFKITGGDTVLVDVFGTYGNDPGTAWTVAGIENATTKHTLVRKDIVCGSTDWAEQAGTDSLDSQWIVKECDDFSNIGTHSIGHFAKVSAFKIAQSDNDAIIDYANNTITLEAVYGTDLTSVVPQLRLSRGATATIGDSTVTATSAFDFSNPVTLKVKSEDGLTTTEWTITINVAQLPSTAADIRTFTFDGITPQVSIDTLNASVNVLLDYGTDITSLTPQFTISAAASVSSTVLIYNDSLKVFTTSEPVSFASPMKIQVAAQDTTVKKDWTVSVSVIQPVAVSIYALQYSTNDTSAYYNQFVSTEGVITSVVANGSGYEMYIQDSAKAWNGVLVYDETGIAKDVKQGDKVKVVGTVTEYFTITEIKIVDIEILSSDNTVEPILLTAEDAMAEAYESVLVTINNMKCTDGSGNTYTVDDETADIKVYNKYKFDGFELTKDSVYNVTGIMYYYSSNKAYEIIPRSTADIVKIEQKNEEKPIEPIDPIDPITEVDDDEAGAVSVYAYNRTIVVENASSDIAVFDIAGRIVAKRAANSSRIELQLPQSGLYIVKVGLTSQKVVLK